MDEGFCKVEENRVADLLAAAAATELRTSAPTVKGRYEPRSSGRLNVPSFSLVLLGGDWKATLRLVGMLISLAVIVLFFAKWSKN